MFSGLPERLRLGPPSVVVTGGAERGRLIHPQDRRDGRGGWARANNIPMLRFTAGERKTDVMAPYVDAARAENRSKVVAVGCAQEYAQVWTATKRDTDPGKASQFTFTKQQRRVSVFYVYIWDTQVGPGFIKICTYFRYPIKVWLN